MTDIVERLCGDHWWLDVTGDEAAAEIKRLRNDYGILKQDYDTLREELADVIEYAAQLREQLREPKP